MTSSPLNIKSVGLITIVTILLLEYAIFPWFDWVSEVKTNIETQSITLKKQERLIAKAILLEEQRDVLETHFLPKLSGLTIVKKNQDSAIMWLKEVELHLAKYELKVNQKLPQREVAINNNFAVYVGRINVKGSYSEVLHLLEKLENESSGNRIRQLRLSSNKALPDIVIADIEFLKVFKRS